MSEPGPDLPCAVMIFARAPVAGACKTRLIPLLGAQGAAALQERLTLRALETAIASGVGPVSLWCAPDAQHEFFARCARRFGVELHTQCEGDLGARMLAAFEHAGGPALLMGADAPSIAGEDVRACSAALATNDCVFLPAEDGGYALVGSRRPCAAIFEAMDWSTSGVMEETRRRLRAAGLGWSEPRMVWDVDEARDYERLVAAGFYAP